MRIRQLKSNSAAEGKQSKLYQKQLAKITSLSYLKVPLEDSEKTPQQQIEQKQDVEQAGFMPNKSTIDMIHVVAMLMEKTVHQEMPFTRSLQTTRKPSVL